METGNIPIVSRLCQFNSARWKHISKYLEKYLKKKDDESLHQARLEIKKLSALFHLLEFGDKSFDSEEELKPVEKIFKLSGKLRDYKNALKFRKQYKIKNTGIKEERKKQRRIREKLKNKLKKYEGRFDKTEKKASQVIKKIEAPKYISPYLYSVKNEIISSAVPGMTSDKLHEIRKKAKELSYLAEFDTGNLLKKTETDMLTQLEDTIGDWHDIDKFYRKTTSRLKNKKHRPMLAGIEIERQNLFAKSKNLLSVFSGKKII